MFRSPKLLEQSEVGNDIDIYRCSAVNRADLRYIYRANVPPALPTREDSAYTGPDLSDCTAAGVHFYKKRTGAKEAVSLSDLTVPVPLVGARVVPFPVPLTVKTE